MLKNKYVFWSGISLWVLALASAGGWLWLHQHKLVALHTASQTSQQTAAARQSTAATNQPVTGQYTISGQTGTAGTQTISGSAGGSSSQGGTVAGDSTNTSANVSKLLDPTSFSQYDKYKNDQSAYFIDLQTGTGTALASGQKAAVYYRGWLTNGTLFDESKAGSDGQLQPFVFTEGQHQVISGWEEALAGMKVGGVRLLIVPPAAGYGAQAQGSIAANSVLVFQVQLAAVQ